MRSRRMHQRVGGDVERCALAVKKAPDQRVEQPVALGVAMADDEADEFAGGARQGDGAGHRRARRREQVGMPAGGPDDVSGRKPAATSWRTACAKPGEVGARG